MKALKVKFKDIVSATNIISDHRILDNNLFQTASNYWLITGKEDVIDPCAGSGSTLLAAAQCDRKAYGFEIKKDFYKEANEKVLSCVQKRIF